LGLRRLLCRERRLRDDWRRSRRGIVLGGGAGSLAYAALVTLAIANRAGSLPIGKGATIGVIVGVLLWFTADFTIYGTTNIAKLTRTVVDPLLEIVHGGIGGAVIAAVLKRMSASSR